MSDCSAECGMVRLQQPARYQSEEAEDAEENSQQGRFPRGGVSRSGQAGGAMGRVPGVGGVEILSQGRFSVASQI